MDSIHSEIMYHASGESQERVLRLEKFLEQANGSITPDDGIDDDLPADELKKLLKIKIKKFLEGIRGRLIKEYDMTLPGANAAIAAWHVKIYLDAAMKIGDFARVRLLLHIVRFSDINYIYEEYMHHFNYDAQGMTLGERRRTIADYRDSLIEVTKEELMRDYGLTRDQADDAISGWEIKQALDMDMEFADLDSAQLWMHYEDHHYTEELYLEYMGFSKELRMCKCHYGEFRINTEVRYEYLKLIRHILFHIFGMSKTDIESGIKQYELEKKVLITYMESENKKNLYELFHRPIINFCREIAESVWEQKEYK